jgi:hypothetical protein
LHSINRGWHGKALNLSREPAELRQGLSEEAWILILTLPDDALGFPSRAG